MILTKKELVKCLREEKNNIYSNRNIIFDYILHSPFYLTWKFLKFLRKEEYYYNKGNRIISCYYRRRKNKLGNRLGFYIPKNVLSKGVRIYHIGQIVVNDHAVIGINARFHGSNCIGNNGGDNCYAPVIGDNLDIGFGAMIIGNVRLGNNVKIGAGAVVIDSFEEDNITLVGIPARKVIRS